MDWPDFGIGAGAVVALLATAEVLRRFLGYGRGWGRSRVLRSEAKDQLLCYVRDCAWYCVRYDTEARDRLAATSTLLFYTTPQSPPPCPDVVTAYASLIEIRDIMGRVHLSWARFRKAFAGSSADVVLADRFRAERHKHFADFDAAAYRLSGLSLSAMWILPRSEIHRMLAARRMTDDEVRDVLSL